MTKVDSKGRIVLPRRIRERLGISPGTEVEIREEDGKAVVEPEDSPEAIVDDLQSMIAAAASDREQVAYADLDARSRDHVETIERQAGDG